MKSQIVLFLFFLTISFSVKAQDLWFAILESQTETGTPYMLYKDSCNYKSNQKNLGTIYSSNLCTEILEVSNKNETAVCNLASVALPKYVLIPSGKVREKDKKLRRYDFKFLYEVVYQATVNLNQVIEDFRTSIIDHNDWNKFSDLFLHDSITWASINVGKTRNKCLLIAIP